MGFVVEKVALGQVFLQVLWFSLSVSIHHGSPKCFCHVDLKISDSLEILHEHWKGSKLNLSAYANSIWRCNSELSKCF
jgi:hypothetical protein